MNIAAQKVGQLVAGGAWGMVMILGLSAIAPVQAQTTPAASAPSSANAAPPAATPSNSATDTDTSGELTLEQSIAIALQQNGDTQAAGRNFNSAQESVRQARSDLYPQVTASLNSQYIDQRGGTVTTVPGGTSGNGRTFTSRGTTTTTDVSISQNLFDAGRTKTRVKQAEASAVGAAGNFGSSRNNLAYDVAQNFYEQLRQARLVTQREGQVTLAQNQLEQIQAQFQAGAVARSDIQSVLVNVSQAKLDLATARNDLRVAQVNFRNTLGLGRGPALTLHDSFPAAAPPTSIDLNNVPGTAPAPAIPTTPPTLPATPTGNEATTTPAETQPELEPLENYVTTADRLRPDILQARASVQNAQAAVKLAKIDAKPQITASAGYSIDPRETGTRGLTVGAGLTVPIFDAGGLKAGVHSAQDTLDASQITLEQTRKDVAADVEAAYVDIQGQNDRLSNATALVQQAQVNLDNSVAKYRAGAGIVLDIVNAQTQLFNAQNSYTSALYDAALSRLNLDRAIGRFAWAAPDESLPASAPNTLSSASATVARLSGPSSTPSMAALINNAAQASTTPAPNTTNTTPKP